MQESTTSGKRHLVLQVDDALLVAGLLVAAQAGPRWLGPAAAAASVVQLVVHRRLEAVRPFVQHMPAKPGLWQSCKHLWHPLAISVGSYDGIADVRCFKHTDYNMIRALMACSQRVGISQAAVPEGRQAAVLAGRGGGGAPAGAGRVPVQQLVRRPLQVVALLLDLFSRLKTTQSCNRRVKSRMFAYAAAERVRNSSSATRCRSSIHTSS